MFLHGAVLSEPNDRTLFDKVFVKLYGEAGGNAAVDDYQLVEFRRKADPTVLHAVTSFSAFS